MQNYDVCLFAIIVALFPSIIAEKIKKKKTENKIKWYRYIYCANKVKSSWKKKVCVNQIEYFVLAPTGALEEAVSNLCQSINFMQYSF